MFIISNQTTFSVTEPLYIDKITPPDKNNFLYIINYPKPLQLSINHLHPHTVIVPIVPSQQSPSTPAPYTHTTP